MPPILTFNMNHNFWFVVRKI